MAILHKLCSIPTAPFVEHRVLDYIDRFAAARPALRLAKDRFGNRLITLPGRSRSPRIIFVAHTDHPGMVARRMLDDRTVEADFRGGVLREFVEGARVRFFDSDREISGVVVQTAAAKQRPAYAGRVRVRVGKRVARNSPGMFDQGIARERNGRFFSRVCDDLAGAAAIITMLDEMLKRSARPRATVGVLLTRAEEDGFVGALAAVLEGTLLRSSDLMVSVECSAAQPYAPQGNGVIVRVGDRLSVFDSALTLFITQQAEELAKRDRSFKHQRALMPGGACEGTVFDSYGYRTAAVCVPLGNYHNMDRKRGRIGPEYIHLSDWKNMVKLFLRIAQAAHRFDPTMQWLKRRLEKRLRLRRSLLEKPGPMDRA